jgi:hypothetical protein
MSQSQRLPRARRRRGILWKVLAALAVLCVVVYVATYDPSTIGYWRSDAETMRLAVQAHFSIIEVRSTP